MKAARVSLSKWLLPLLLAASGCSDLQDDARATAPLRVAMSTFSDGTFLPWNGSTGRKPYLDPIYDYLVYLDPVTLEPKPGLAERWEMGPNGDRFTLWLRSGVQFQEGWGELTAADVEYTFRRMMAPDSIAGMASTLRFLITDVRAVDRYEITMSLREPDIDFVAGYLSNAVAVPIASRAYLEAVGDAVANEKPVGTGPFALSAYREETYIELTAVNGGSGHWRVQPQFETLRFLSVPEEFTRAAMLKAGEVDIAPINYDSIDALAADGIRTLYVNGNWAPVIRFGGLVEGRASSSVPWHHRAVRQAMNYAIDKEAIVRHILHGQARITASDFPVAEWEELAPFPYDPAKARALLAEAGYPDGFDMVLRTFTTSPGAELPIIAEVVAGYWRAVGIRATIVPTTWTSLRTAWSTGNANDIAWTHRGLAFPNVLQGLFASVHTSNLFATFANGHTDEEIAAIGAELDRAERAVLIRRLGQYLRDEASNVYIGVANEPYGISPRVDAWPTLSQVTNLDLVTRAPH
jgi:peptide/nickel transport system substrate-binding protein